MVPLLSGIAANAVATAPPTSKPAASILMYLPFVRMKLMLLMEPSQLKLQLHYSTNVYWLRPSTIKLRRVIVLAAFDVPHWKVTESACAVVVSLVAVEV